MNVIGNGLIAAMVRNVQSDAVLFCSGVSNSSETSAEAFTRERECLKSTGKLDIYVSSVCAHTSDTPYAAHKRTCEGIAKEKGATIVRLPNVVPIGGLGNKSNMLRFFCECVLKKVPITAFTDASRYFVDRVCVVAGVEEALRRQSDVDVAGHPNPIPVHAVIQSVFTGLRSDTKVITVAGGSPQLVMHPFVVYADEDALSAIENYAAHFRCLNLG